MVSTPKRVNSLSEQKVYATRHQKSTTQTQTGAMIGGSWADGGKNVNWKVWGRIFLGWVLTIPAAGGLATLLFIYAYYSPSS